MGGGGEPYTVVHEDQLARSHSEYSTDLLAEELIAFVEETEGPFLAFWAPLASHVGGAIFDGPVPADRHVGAMDDLPDWRPPSYDFVHPDQPDWLRDAQASYDQEDRDATDEWRRLAYETLLAVDEQFAAILEAVPDSTIIVVTSDNGVSWGEHGLFNQAKGCPYDECTRVPLMIRSPRSSRRVIERLTMNIDIAPIVMDLLGLELLAPIDGHTGRRQSVVIESEEDFLSLAPTWTARRTRKGLAVDLATGESERYWLPRDPDQMEPSAPR